MRTVALCAVLLLAGCATAPVVDPPTALNGRELDTALNLYGRWDQKVVLQGRPYYIWRRAVLLNGATYYCELRAEVGFRDTIKTSVVEGYPAACGLFNVQYTSTFDPRTREPLPAQPAPGVLASEIPRNYRPVGGPRQSASVTDASQAAAARPPAPAAGPDGSY